MHFFAGNMPRLYKRPSERGGVPRDLLISIPKSNRNKGPHNRSNRPMWMNNTALVKVKSQNEAYKCYRNTMDVKDYEKYSKARNQAPTTTDCQITEYYREVQHEATSNLL